MSGFASEPTGQYWDSLVSDALLELRGAELEKRLATLVGWREQHEKITARVMAEREPPLLQLILEREGGRR